MRTAADRRAELVDLDGQIQKKQSEQAIAQAKDQTALTEAERNVVARQARHPEERPDLEGRGREEHARARAGERAARAAARRRSRSSGGGGRRICASSRSSAARAERALQLRREQRQLMSVTAPFPGLVVLKQVWKGNTHGRGRGRRGSPARPADPRHRRLERRCRCARCVNQADVGCDRAGPAREDPSRRVSGAAVRRPGRARGAARRAELADAEGAHVRRARVDPGHRTRS